MSAPRQPPAPVPAAASAQRAPGLDALRGAAMVWMMGYHLAFDLNHLGWLRPPADVYRDPVWTTQRLLIVSLFLLCAGMGQAAALQAGQGWPRFWRRWAQVAGCALAVSAGSALMFPRSWISFGVLHGIAVMLLLVRALAPRLGNPALLALAAACLLLPQGLSHPFFDSRWTNWVGLVTQKPVTEDFVPLLPWLGVLLAGVVAGRWMGVPRPRGLLAPAGAGQGILGRFGAGVVSGLALLGRWPLTVYMLHQPLFIGVLTALAAIRPPAPG